MTSGELIIGPLKTVRYRSYVQRLLTFLCTGFFWGCLFAILAILFHLLGAVTIVSPWKFLGIFTALGLISSGSLGLFLPLKVQKSARKIDSHYHLNDRMMTAMEILMQNDPTTMERLQVSDTAKFAAVVDARVVVPYRVPENFYSAMIMFFVASMACMISAPSEKPRGSEVAFPVQDVIAITNRVRKELVVSIEEIVETTPEEKPLEKLKEEIQKQMRQLENANGDTKEALAMFSQIEATINLAMSEFHLEAMETSMQELAEALSLAEATRSVGHTMKKGEYFRAADGLEIIDLSEMSKQERKAVSDQLKKVADNMQERNQAFFAKPTEEFAENFQEGNVEKSKDSVCEIANIFRKQGRRKEICKNLNSKLTLLSLWKSECTAAHQQSENRRESNQKSEKNSNNWGLGTADMPQNQREASLSGNREMKPITGTQGDGPSEFEVIHSDENFGSIASLPYQKVYQDYRKESESVLKAEPIPLGQRQMIRRYFESIRPKDGE